MATIILAGGKGERLRSVTADIPKTLFPVAGKPFLHWLISWVEAQGETDIVLASRHLWEQVELWAKQENLSRPSFRLRVLVEAEPLDTGGAAVYAAGEFEAGYYLVLNGDSITFVSLRKARDALNHDPDLSGVLVAVAVDDAARYGSLDIGADGLLLGFAEKRPGAGFINAGIYLLRSELMINAPQGRTSMERDLFPLWLKAGHRFRVAVSREPFIDIGTPETFAAATDFIKRHKRYFDGLETLPIAELLGD